ncbi:hypothetical protein [Blastococcus mobilis]|nr:hypothetical protein [Blastococcus mobilis]
MPPRTRAKSADTPPAIVPVLAADPAKVLRDKAAEATTVAEGLESRAEKSLALAAQQRQIAADLIAGADIIEEARRG